ncbi:MAG: hypothetical protein MRY74_12335 [Neomegalonema sp.]|nr:hypothetical protein [Neomegalonema sp.]
MRPGTGFITASAALLLTLGASAAFAKEETGYKYARFVLATSDKNGDGKVSRREMPPSGRENFDEIDTNEDGYASVDEIAAWYRSYSRINTKSKE